MKKVVIPVVIIVFFVCAFFGYKAASNLLPDKQSSTQISMDAVTNPGSKQENFLFIHVNDLTIEEPELISIWVGFVNKSTPPQFMFLPIFPATNVEIQDRIIQRFNLSSDKKVSRRFLNQLISSFNLDISGYILSDDKGVSYSNQWLTGVETPITSIPAKSDEEKNTLLSNEQNAWQQFCQLVSTGTANTYFSAINWGLLIPDHFSTDLDFENITLLTDQIVHASSSVKCEILPGD